MVLHKYLSDSGRDLIMEYIDSLPEEERIDGGMFICHLLKLI